MASPHTPWYLGLSSFVLSRCLALQKTAKKKLALAHLINEPPPPHPAPAHKSSTGSKSASPPATPRSAPAPPAPVGHCCKTPGHSARTAMQMLRGARHRHQSFATDTSQYLICVSYTAPYFPLCLSFPHYCCILLTNLFSFGEKEMMRALFSPGSSILTGLTNRKGPLGFRTENPS